MQNLDELDDFLSIDLKNVVATSKDEESLEEEASSAELPTELTHQVEAAQVGERLDKILTELKPELGLSRAHVQRLIDENNVTVNAKPSKAGYKLRLKDKLWVRFPPPVPLVHLVPENIPLDIVYEDSDMMVINKPAGLVVHPAPGHSHGTLVNALLYHVPGLSINGNERPGIVHRLDKDTSGLLVVAKNDLALQNLINQMKDRTILKEYLTLVEGNVQPTNGIIDAPIGRDPGQRKQMAIVSNGKPARTAYYVRQELVKHSYIQARLETGRTHQIRVHFAYLGHPVAGDPVYGRRKQVLTLKRQFLHAYKLGLRLPSTQEYREWEVPLPADLAAVLEEARQITE
jgi:23S rRNA pseudouridine1911/1915/1917 synthase